MGKPDLDIAHLSAMELDDQALQEISTLLTGSGITGQSPARLTAAAASGQLVVARRPCGMLPEIVGVALRPPCGQGKVVVATEALRGALTLARSLRRRLGRSAAASLFRRRDRAPLGLMSATR